MKENLKRKTNLIKEYLITQGILEESECIFKMDFFPDFEYTDFQKGRIQTYYFHEEISFSNIYSDIISYSEITPHIFPVNEKPDFLKNITNLKKINNIDKEKFLEIKIPDKFDLFELQKIHLYSVDNIEKTLNYDCTCKTEGAFIGNDFIDIYCTVHLCGITNNINSCDLYNQLIVDSYRKYQSKDYRMAFFLMFSAFECFINTKLGKQDEEKRLKEKKNELFKSIFPTLNANQIYSYINIKKHEKIRNEIAHGRKELYTEKSSVDDIYFDFISLIISYNEKIEKFNDLKNYINVSNTLS